MRNSVLLLVFGVTSVFGQSVRVTTGGFRVTAPKYNYYYETIQETQVEYSNPLLVEGTQVEIEYAVPKRVVDGDDAPLQYERAKMTFDGGDSWKFRFQELRHGLGARWIRGEIFFLFYITPPGKQAVKVECEDSYFSTKGLYTASFNRISELPWRKGDEPFTLEPVKVECDS